MKSPDPKAVRAARLENGLTQTQAAALVYSSCRTWQKWESGDRRMHQATFELFLMKVGKMDEV